MIQLLDVYLWSQKVGSLVAYKEKYTTKACFYYDKEFINGKYDIAPLRASIKSKLAQQSLPIYAESDKNFGGLPSFIADSLPDKWGNKVFDRWAKSNNIVKHEVSSLDRLAYMGKRSMGALEFIPPMAAEMESPFKVEIGKLYDMTQMAFDEAGKFHASLNANIMIQSLFKIGTSAGGRRPKAIINVNLETMDCYSGQVASPEPGFTPMLIKFDEHTDVPTTHIEYSYYLMACTAGLTMMPSRLITVNNSAHFLTERFDRRGDEKIHIQSLAAMNPTANSYEDLFEVASLLNVDNREMVQLYLLMVMNVLCANVDDHNKNFSFLMDRDGVWHIAPAYDFTFAVDTSAPWYVNRHCMTINGNNDEISRSDMLTIAKQYNIKDANSVIDNAMKVVSEYSTFAKEAQLEDAWAERIKSVMARNIELMM
jgi:serine/threonine-protein kinase HipA